MAEANAMTADHPRDTLHESEKLSLLQKHRSRDYRLAWCLLMKGSLLSGSLLSFLSEQVER